MTKFCFLRVGYSLPASGLLVRRSRPGANIEAQPRFNPRSGRVGLFFLTRMVYLEVFFGAIQNLINVLGDMVTVAIEEKHVWK